MFKARFQGSGRFDNIQGLFILHKSLVYLDHQDWDFHTCNFNIAHAQCGVVAIRKHPLNSPPFSRQYSTKCRKQLLATRRWVPKATKQKPCD